MKEILYVVKADHPIFARTDKYNLTLNESCDLIEVLNRFDYVNITLESQNKDAEVSVKIEQCSDCPWYKEGRGVYYNFCYHGKFVLTDTSIPKKCPLI
jgi:hypothetical protein